MTASTANLVSTANATPFDVVNAEAKRPVLLVCDHASKRIPPELANLGLSSDQLDSHIAWDLGAADLCRQLAATLDCTAVLAGYSRLVVDCNRRLNDPTAFVEVADGVPVSGNRELDNEQRWHRVKNYFMPYHGAIQEQLNRLLVQGMTPALLSIHSFTPVLEGFHRPWQVGVMWDRDHRVAQPLMHNLRTDHDVEVGDNEPYSGRHHWDYTVDHHAEASGLPHVVIEVRQDLLTGTNGITHWTQVLSAALQPILAEESLYRMEKFA